METSTSFTQDRLLGQPPLVDMERKFLLHVTAKSANTTLKLWFFENIQILQKLKHPKRAIDAFGWRFPAMLLTRPAMMNRISLRGFASDGDLRGFSDMFRQYYCRQMISSGATAGFRRILVTRNPYDRIVSAFIDKFCGEDINKQWVREVVQEAGDNGTITFDQFLNYLLGVNEDRCNSHWRRQTYRVDGVKIDYLIKLENLKEGFSAIKHVTGGGAAGVLDVRRQANRFDKLPDSVGRINETTSNLEITGFRQRHGYFPAKNHFLNEGTMPKIASIFREDFNRLDYET